MKTMSTPSHNTIPTKVNRLYSQKIPLILAIFYFSPEICMFAIPGHLTLYLKYSPMEVLLKQFQKHGSS